MSDIQTPIPAIPPQEAAAILRWYIAAGVDIATGEPPIDRTVLPAPPQNTVTPALATQSATVRPTPQPRPATQPSASPQAFVPDVSDVSTLVELRERIETHVKCPLRSMATQTVFGNGLDTADLMVIGEAPGADEDRSGIPFVGKAGQLLNRMLASIDMPRESVYVTNVILWRPPGNRTPTQEEVSLCLPLILRTIELVQPRAILLLGGSAAHALLDSHAGITRLRGQWKTIERPQAGLSIPTMATFHPAYLLRQPAQKAFAWQDLLSLKALLAETASKSDL